MLLFDESRTHQRIKRVLSFCREFPRLLPRGVCDSVLPGTTKNSFVPRSLPVCVTQIQQGRKLVLRERKYFIRFTAIVWIPGSHARVFASFFSKDAIAGFQDHSVGNQDFRHPLTGSRIRAYALRAPVAGRAFGEELTATWREVRRETP